MRKAVGNNHGTVFFQKILKIVGSASKIRCDRKSCITGTGDWHETDGI